MRPCSIEVETGMGHASRKALFFAITTALAVGLAAASPAAAMKPTITFAAPSPAEGATLSSDAVSFAFGYNKKPNATAALSCVLSGPTSSSDACDAPVASGKKGSRSGTSYRALANGSYALTVTLTLTDGGKASATRHFTVDVPPGSGTPATSTGPTPARARSAERTWTERTWTRASSPAAS
jgi:hypothetical protein